MNSPPAFTDQSKKQLSAPNFTDVTHSLKLARASLPCFSATSYSTLRGNTGVKHQLQQPSQDAPGAATATVIFPTLPVVLTPFFVIFLHLPTLPFNSMSLSQPAHLLPLSCYYFLMCSVRNCWSLREVLNCWSLREAGLRTQSTWLPMGQTRLTFCPKGTYFSLGEKRTLTWICKYSLGFGFEIGRASCRERV